MAHRNFPGVSSFLYLNFSSCDRVNYEVNFSLVNIVILLTTDTIHVFVMEIYLMHILNHIYQFLIQRYSYILGKNISPTMTWTFLKNNLMSPNLINNIGSKIDRSDLICTPSYTMCIRYVPFRNCLSIQKHPKPECTIVVPI
jgi:hypothetical protein